MAWEGDSPYYLMFVSPEYDVLRIDLDERGWMSKYPELFRSTGEMYLIRKSGEEVVLSVNVDPGEQSYYVARHIGFTGSGQGAEAIAYGIGKKRLDGNEDNLWILPWGQVCVGKDVEHFALSGLRKGLG